MFKIFIEGVFILRIRKNQTYCKHLVQGDNAVTCPGLLKDTALSRIPLHHSKRLQDVTWWFCGLYSVSQTVLDCRVSCPLSILFEGARLREASMSILRAIPFRGFFKSLAGNSFLWSWRSQDRQNRVSVDRPNRAYSQIFLDLPLHKQAPLPRNQMKF